MANNIFYRIHSERGIRLITIPEQDCNLRQFWKLVAQKHEFRHDLFKLGFGTRILKTNSLDDIYLPNNSHLDILIPLVGGKGGFGSLLRAIGAQIEKTTNRDACRDLQGRRLRDVKREEELRKLIALQEKLEIERKRRKEEKLEKLRKGVEASSASISIQELVDMFDDREYNNRRHQIGDIIDAAVEKGLINSKKREHEDDQAPSIVKLDKKKRKGDLWLGIDSDENEDY